MTFVVFLTIIREHFGNKCSDEYWKGVYDRLEKKTATYVQSELPYMAIHAVAESRK